MFVYAIRSPNTKESYFRRLRRFFDGIELARGTTLEERCNTFAHKGKNDPKWAFNNILRFLQSQKERVQKKEITGGTLRNYVKTIKMFCEVTDIFIPWKKITRGLPKGKRYADDRAPTIEEIKKIIEYPDRRIKPAIYVMASSGIRVGAWDYLRWSHFIPIIRDNKIVAAKIVVYADEDEEYYTFCSAQAYFSVKSWMDYREQSGEIINESSWVMRSLWDSTKPCASRRFNVDFPKKLTSIGIKRLVERALWSQGIRNKLQNGKRRHEFQCDHGFRKWHRTQCELAGLKVSNIEILLNHSMGISDSYYRVTEAELLQDYLKAVDNFLTIGPENLTEFEMGRKELEVKTLTEGNSLNSDAIASLSDQVMNLMKEIEILKGNRDNNTSTSQ